VKFVEILMIYSLPEYRHSIVSAMKIFLTISFILYTTVASSQGSFKIIGGLTSSIIKQKESADGRPFTRRYAGHIGFLGGVKITEHSGINAGIIYSSRGATFETQHGYLPFTEINGLKLNYLEIPLLYSIGSSFFSLSVGPQYAALLSAKIEGRSDWSDVKSSFSSSSFDLRYGIGLNPGRFGFHFHFVTGLSDILKTSEYTWRSNSFNVGVSYNFLRAESGVFKKEDDIPHRMID
jgi:hypothetical protein